MSPTKQEPFRYRQVEARILEMVESGALTPGDRVPSLRRMSRSMGMGLSTVSHAYLELEAKGVLEARPRSGFYLRQGPAPVPSPRPAPSSAPHPPRAVQRAKLISTVLESLGNPHLTPLGVVCPDQALLPVKALGRILGRVFREQGKRAVGYSPVQGHPGLRLQIARRMAEVGAPVSPDELLVTSGALEGLFISLRCLTRPGDNVVVAAPTYYCFLQLLETLGLRAVEVASHPERGVDPEDVAHAVDAFGASAVILNPNYNNPDGSLTPEAAKDEIVELLARRGVPLVEDDVSGDLHFDAARPSTLKERDRHGLVLHVSSFSKTVAPGFRVGWLAPGRFLDKALEMKATSNVSVTTPVQLALEAYMAEGHFQRHLRRLRTDIASQMESLRHHLGRSFPDGTRITRPRGGLMLWVEMPGGADGVDLFYRAREAGISVVPGAVFSTRERFDNYLRISCGSPVDAEMVAAVERLGGMLAG